MVWRHQYYKLIGTLVVPAKDLMDWAVWCETADRQVDITRFDTTFVSTVFLGLDHRIYSPLTADDAEPIVFETMIFPDDIWEYQTRCSTYEQALAMHQRAVLHVRKMQRQLPVVIHEN